MKRKGAGHTRKRGPLEKDLLGQNSAISSTSRIIGGSIQDLPAQSDADSEEFEYVNPETESSETRDGHVPRGEKHFKSNGAGGRYGGPNFQKSSEIKEDRADFTGSNGEIRREINRKAEHGTPPTKNEAKGIPPPVK